MGFRIKIQIFIPWRMECQVA